VALEALRRNLRAPLFVRMHDTFSMEPGDVMVGISDDATAEEEATTLAMGADVARLWEGTVLAARFETVPEQVSLSDAERHVTEDDRSFEERVHDLEATTDVPTEAHEIVCHDVGRAALNFVRSRDVQLMLGTLSPGRWHPEMLGTDVDWFVRKMPCEVAFFAPHAADGRAEALREIVVLLPRAPYGPMKAFVADALALAHDARIRFLTAMGPDGSEDEVDTVQAFHDRLADHCDSPTSSQIIRTEDLTAGLVEATGDADLAIVGTMARSRLRDLFFPNRTTDLLTALPCDVLLVRPQRPRENTPFRRLIERAVF
jgi:nucleotide-binding universal stress UspA family protein